MFCDALMGGPAGKGLEVLGESGKQLATSSSRLQHSAWAPWLKIMTGVKNLNGPAGSSELINPRPRGGRKRARSNSPMARSKSPVSTVDGYSPLKESTSWSKSRHFGSRSAENASPSPRDGKRQASKGAHSRATRPGKWWWTITVVAVTQFLAAFYLSLVHQRGLASLPFALVFRLLLSVHVTRNLSDSPRDHSHRSRGRDQMDCSTGC